MKNINKAWREASSLITVVRQNRIPNVAQYEKVDYCTNYDILLERRTQTASAFANHIVFPGGVCETTDSSDKWIQLLKSFGYKQQHFDLFHSKGFKTNPIFKENPVLRHIALRITAIRETFEETGLLICSQKHCEEKSSPWANALDVDIDFWQNKVSNDPMEFYNLCEQLKCYPDIWSLYYWSNWLTPVHLKRRFDTVFFLAALEDKPKNIKSSSEISTVEWCSIEEILSKNHKLGAEISPPQLAEFNRLLKFHTITDLITYAKEVNSRGSNQIFPWVLQSKDGLVFILPGDDHYPSEIDYNHKIVDCRDKTTIELRQGAHILRRMELNKKTGNKKLIVKNYNEIDNYL